MEAYLPQFGAYLNIPFYKHGDPYSKQLRPISKAFHSHTPNIKGSFILKETPQGITLSGPGMNKAVVIAETRQALCELGSSGVAEKLKQQLDIKS